MSAGYRGSRAAPVVARVSAEACKLEGNAKLIAGEDRAASDCYEQGIQAAICEGLSGGRLLSQLRSGKAQALLRLGDAEAAFKCCAEAVANDPLNGKAYWRGATAAMKLDRPKKAAEFCRQGLAAVGESAALRGLLEEAEDALAL
eukprot:CAMPEP_0204207248 /NCGR_PEP_ID=MMETSP0361-20130328/71629_1 /ASSEMBLY_ACC=CAM_ASM_000343 /TAXON_ID=268821 /ORGANISM="Scrippsiella Hangoei, Strain SHTV-5" /LENGTH=144 /DNA_ID=CAMNT_0051170805 /DNA_START=26 /DNA_END=457 /DNA_ORIENTATION=+